MYPKRKTQITVVLTDGRSFILPSQDRTVYLHALHLGTSMFFDTPLSKTIPQEFIGKERGYTFVRIPTDLIAYYFST